MFTSGRSALMAAAAANQVDMAIFLLNNKADLYQQDIEGRFCNCYADEKNQVQMRKFFCDYMKFGMKKAVAKWDELCDTRMAVAEKLRIEMNAKRKQDRR